MEDFFVVDIPVFVPEYDKDKKYGWTNYKDELWDLLKKQLMAIVCIVMIAFGSIKKGADRPNME